MALVQYRAHNTKALINPDALSRRCAGIGPSGNVTVVTRRADSLQGCGTNAGGATAGLVALCQCLAEHVRTAIDAPAGTIEADVVLRGGWTGWRGRQEGGDRGSWGSMVGSVRRSR